MYIINMGHNKCEMINKIEIKYSSERETSLYINGTEWYKSSSEQIMLIYNEILNKLSSGENLIDLAKISAWVLQNIVNEGLI